MSNNSRQAVGLSSWAGCSLEEWAAEPPDGRIPVGDVRDLYGPPFKDAELSNTPQYPTSTVPSGSQSSFAPRAQCTLLGSTPPLWFHQQFDPSGVLTDGQAAPSYREWPEGHSLEVDAPHHQPYGAPAIPYVPHLSHPALAQGIGLGRLAPAPVDQSHSDFQRAVTQIKDWLETINVETDPAVVPTSDAGHLPNDVTLFGLLSQGRSTIPLPATPTYLPAVASPSNEYCGRETARPVFTSPTNCDSAWPEHGMTLGVRPRYVPVTPSSTAYTSPYSSADSPAERPHVSSSGVNPAVAFRSTQSPYHHAAGDARPITREVLGMLEGGAEVVRQPARSGPPYPGAALTSMADHDDPTGADMISYVGDDPDDGSQSDGSDDQATPRTPQEQCPFCGEWHRNLRRHIRATCQSPDNPKRRLPAMCPICGGTEGQNRARHRTSKMHVAAMRRAEHGS